MILGCPECHTRFAIDAQALRPDGRRVKCGKCDHVWFEEPPPPSAAEPLSVTPLEPEEQSRIPTPNLPAVTVADQKRTAGAAWILVGLLLAVIVSLGWFGRESIAQAWPPAESIYASIGVNAFPLPGEGFSVDMEVKRVDQSLQLVGEVLNTTDESLPLPPIYGVLQDANGKQLRHWRLDVGAQLLGPGEKVPFSTEIETIPEGTANVSVLFTNPAENQ
jgi:predicted Zn finger-like uncharacterized protein